MRFINPDRKEILTVYIYAIFSGIISLSLPLGIQAIISFLFGNTYSASIVVLIGVVLLSVLLNGYLQVMQMKIVERIQRKIFTRYSLGFSQKLTALDLVSVDNYYLPELTNRFLDTASLQKGVSKILLEFPTASIQIIFGLLLLSFYSPMFIAFGAMLVLLLYLIFRITGLRGLATSNEESNYKYDVAYWLEEVARVVKNFKLMGRTTYPILKTDRLVSGYLDAKEAHFKILLTQYWAFIVFKFIITGALLILGSVLFVNQQINLGQFIAAEIVIILIVGSVEKLIQSLDAVYDFLTAIEKVDKLLDKDDEHNGALIVPNMNGNGFHIEMSHVVFRYPMALNPSLYIPYLNINGGERWCIMGRLGAGKTSLMRLLTGAYQIESGSIMVNQVAISNLDLGDYRKQIGLVVGTRDIFSDSIYNNITLGDPSIERTEVVKICKGLGLWDFLIGLPHDLETHINTLGKNLPDTVIFKILIARSLAKQPKLLLLEDCWSQMEKIDQEQIQQYLLMERKQFTLIASSNEESFARLCDFVLLMDDGKMVKHGTPQEVLACNEYHTILLNSRRSEKV
ncbi:MAG: ATP-binding cassette domain-containing protein [Chitinophagales bacterium]|nr:ATP-binding cassette domain-containing protein [Chitinophagales bacterium]